MLMIAILLFNLLFRSMSSFRGVRRTAVQMPMLRGSRGWLFFGFRSTRCGTYCPRYIRALIHAVTASNYGCRI